MVSRCKIISRSSNELYSYHNMPYDLQDEDVWFNQDKLYQDHILEILQKWDAIDDEVNSYFLINYSKLCRFNWCHFGPECREFQFVFEKETNCWERVHTLKVLSLLSNLIN